MATRGRIRYGTKIGNRFNISNDIEELKEVDSKTNILTGFDIDTTSFTGDEGYFVKQSGSGEKAVLIRVQNLNTANPKVRGFKPLNYSTYGMAYYADYVYITSKGSTVVKSSAKSRNDTPKVYEVKDTDGALSGCQAITHYTGNKFIVMANAKKENSNLCFWVGAFNDSELTFDVSEKFYVKNTTGNQYIRDIYYHPSYGLFIATNKRGGTVSNMIMRVEIDREADSTYNGEALYNPDAEYKFDGIASRYPEFNVMGLSIGRDGILYTAVKVTKEDGQYTDAGVFLISNMKFTSSGTIEINIDCNKGVKIPDPTFTYTDGKTYTCGNPGAFAINGYESYCMKTYTGTTPEELTNNASILCYSPDVTKEEFSRLKGSKIYQNLGHANGMTYYDDALYVAAYDRDENSPRREIAKIDLKDEEKKVSETYQCNQFIGGISHYNDEEFILANYESDTGSYAKNPQFFVGTFSSERFHETSNFSVTNPIFDTSYSNVLQDIHYTPEHGLFYVVKRHKKVNGNRIGAERICRVTPDQIKNAVSGKPITPKEVYIHDNTVTEVESMASCENGYLYFCENGYPDNACKIASMFFYKDTI